MGIQHDMMLGWQPSEERPATLWWFHIPSADGHLISKWSSSHVSLMLTAPLYNVFQDQKKIKEEMTDDMQVFENHLFSHWPHSAYRLKLDCVGCLLCEILFFWVLWQKYHLCFASNSKACSLSWGRRLDGEEHHECVWLCCIWGQEVERISVLSWFSPLSFQNLFP